MDDDDDRKPSIWAHLGCRITASDGSSFGHLKRPHLLCFVLFSVAAARRYLVAVCPFRHSLSSACVLLEVPHRGGGNEPGGDDMFRSPPPAAGGRNEPRRSASSLPPRKALEEDGGEGNGDRERKETSSVAGRVKETNAKVCVIQ